MGSPYAGTRRAEMEIPYMAGARRGRVEMPYEAGTRRAVSLPPAYIVSYRIISYHFANSVSVLTELTCTVFPVFGTPLRNMYHETPYCYRIIPYQIVSF